MPEFQPIKIEHKPIIDSYVKQYEFDCAEFTFTNVAIWGRDDKIQWAEIDDMLCFLLRFGKHPPFMFPPIPMDRSMAYYKAVDGAVRYFHKIGAQPRFRSVNGIFVEKFQQECPQFTLVPDRDMYDYVYSAQDLISLAGNKLHSKRNHLNKFNSLYEYEYRPLTVDMADECMNLYLSWLQAKDIHEHGILGEMKAIQFMLPNMKELELVGGSIYIAGKLVAFTIGEQIRKDTALIHIEKADASYAGLYAAINQQFAEHEWSHVTYINREDDMGIPGMRKAKLSYQPIRMIEKFDAVLMP